MKAYVVSLAAGILVGVVYSLLKVRSPAPPVIALVGLAGILVGEQLIPLARQMLSGSGVVAAWRQAHCAEHVFGELPGAEQEEARVDGDKPS
jgi:XapX domain-containing protein